MSYRGLLDNLYPGKPVLHTSRAILSAPVRHVFMIGAIWRLSREREPENGFDVLEIGTWFGASALSWAQGLKTYCGGKGSITCVDAWAPFFQDSPDRDADYAKEMDALLDSDIAYEIFLHNIRTVPGSIGTQHLRGRSENVLPLLRDDSFDIVFIDADHAYRPVHRDILNSLRLVKNGGIICGDDLNLQLHECDSAFIEEHSENDTAIDPLSGRKCHPGVTLAVARVFGKVSAWAGFWAMQKSGDAWQPITLQSMPVAYPEHFPPEAVSRARAHFEDLNLII